MALPVNGVVTAGGASINQGAGSTTITQTSQNAAINWQSFNIGQGEAVRFIQPSSNSVALNRVLGSDPSSILGSLIANGKVFLINPNGILFGLGAQVNVSGLVASTHNLTDNDFMAGRYHFAGNSSATVINQGTINADGGYVALLGANVSNNGIIVARLGTVALAAGNAMTLDVAGDGLLNVTINQGAVDALVANGGLIQADGGYVLLTAKAAGTLLQSAVNNTGVIQAQSIDNRNGTIMLMGDMQIGTVNVGGTLVASGTGAGQTGGNITVTGHHTGLFDAHINASGDAGGGVVLIGGDYQGKNPAVVNATATYMSAGSIITADAINTGNGGKVILWGNESTRAYGSITSRGGALGGNGGLIETSAHWLDVAGIRIDASAPNGKNGLWLLDPADITIDLGPTVGMPAVPPGNVFAPLTGVNTAVLAVADLIAALQAGGGTNVTLTTTNTGVQGAPASGRGDITIATALTWNPVTTATLTLNAVGDVNINAAVTTTRGSFEVCCGRDINVNALITATGVAATPNTGGNVLLAAGRDVNIVRAAATGPLPSLNLAGITTTHGNIEICAGNNINLGNTANGAALLTLTSSVAASSPPTGPVTPRGMTLMAGTNGTGPGAAGGTLNIGVGTKITVTGPAGVSPINIFYNPTAYATPTDYSGFFATGNGAPYTQFMLVFPDGANRIYDSTNIATFTGLKGAPAGVTLAGAGVANFDTKAVGANKTVTFTGFSLAQGAVQNGGLGINYALANTCCGTIEGKTTANITPLAITGSITAADKVFDSTTSAIITGRTLAGNLAGDDVSYTGGSATFDTPVAGVGKTVTGTGLGLSGTDAGNYTVNPIAATTAAITPIIVVPPIVVPPIVVPPGVVPPGVAPPPIGSTPIADTEPLPEEMLGVENGITPAATLGIVPAPMPRVVLAGLPPQLLTVAPIIVPAVREPAPLPPAAAPAEIPPPVYAPPLRLRKQDRN
jgi:filamentous hemagglutinin family protein